MLRGKFIPVNYHIKKEERHKFNDLNLQLNLEKKEQTKENLEKEEQTKLTAGRGRKE